MLPPRNLGFDFTQDHFLVLLTHEQILHFMAQGHPTLLGLVALLQSLLQSCSRSVDFGMPGFQADAGLFMLLTDALQRNLGIYAFLAQCLKFARLLLSLDFQLVSLLLQGVDAVVKESFRFLPFLHTLGKRCQLRFGGLAVVPGALQSLFSGG